jgi:hypothetical protein
VLCAQHAWRALRVAEDPRDYPEVDLNQFTEKQNLNIGSCSLSQGNSGEIGQKT